LKIKRTINSSFLDVNLQKEVFDPYFCPKCQVLFIKNFNTYDSKEVNFYCSACEHFFTKKDYEKMSKGKRFHKLPTSYTKHKNVQTVIKSMIQRLYIKGYAQRDIINITKFTKADIEKYTKLASEPLETLTIKDFKQQYLKITEDLDRDTQIVSAIEFGCTVRDLQQLFKVSNRKIATLRNNRSKKILRKNKICIEGENVKIFKLSK